MKLQALKQFLERYKDKASLDIIKKLQAFYDNLNPHVEIIPEDELRKFTLLLPLAIIPANSLEQMLIYKSFLELQYPSLKASAPSIGKSSHILMPSQQMEEEHALKSTRFSAKLDEPTSDDLGSASQI